MILIILGVLFGLLIIYEFMLFCFLDNNPDYYQIDRCIDSSGCWDDVDNVAGRVSPMLRPYVIEQK